MTRKMLTSVMIIAAMLLSVLAFSSVSEAQTSTETDCEYDEFIAGCRKQIVYVDDVPDNVDTRSSFVSTPDGLREAECWDHPFNAGQTLCVLGILLCSDTVFTLSNGYVCSFAAEAVPNPQPTAGCPDGFTNAGVVQGVQVCNPATPVSVPVPSFTG